MVEKVIKQKDIKLLNLHHNDKLWIKYNND